MPLPEYWLDVQVEGQTLVLRLHGDMDLISADQVARTIATDGVGLRSVVLDLSDLDFMDSSGLRLILELQTCPQDSRVGFVAPHGVVAQLMKVTGVASMLNWVPDPAPQG